MYEYQDTGIEWLQRTPLALLGDEPGLGKTRQLLLAAEGATLVVCPAMLAGVWRVEAEKWRPDIDLTTVSYSSLCERAANAKGAKTKVQPNPRPAYRQPWDTLIFDEAHYLKGRNTSWTRASLKLQATRRWLATGTPIPNYANELYITAQMLHPGDARFSSYWRWAAEWFPIWQPQWGGRKVGQQLRPDRTWAEFNSVNLGDRYLARSWDDVGHQLPPLTHQTIEVAMVPAQRKAYDSMRADYIAEVNGVEVVAWTAGARETQLVKMCTGLELVGGTGSGKLDALRELLTSWDSRPVIIVCHFRETARQAMRICKSLGITAMLASGEVPPARRFAVAERFQQGEGTALVATIDAISEGLTLTRASRLVFVEKSYRPSRNQQAERRIWRLGQQHACLVVDLVTKDSIDARIRALLDRKTDIQMKALRPSDLLALL